MIDGTGNYLFELEVTVIYKRQVIVNAGSEKEARLKVHEMIDTDHDEIAGLKVASPVDWEVEETRLFEGPLGL